MLVSLALVFVAGVAIAWAESLEMLRQRAENGDRDAQCDLALRYYEGKGGAPKDDGKAFYWAKKSAEQGHADAQSWVGYFYEKGYGTEKDSDEAFYWYRRAAEQGDRSAQNCLGELYYYGRGVERDFEKAAQWYKKSADQGFPSALFNIGWCYENGEGVGINRSLALDYYRKAAAGGDTCARDRLAELGESADYSASTSTTSTSSSHVNSSTLANAQAGDAVSQLVVGRQYFDVGNYEQALYWWRTAAKQGYGKASMQLGECYYNGSGVNRNLTTAVHWYTEAAEQGEKDACFKLGTCYEQGTGVTRDYQIAVSYYEKGDFMQAAALCYRKWLQQNRTGFNYLKASRSELLLHASQGDALAQCHLGLSDYADGDFSDAKSWFAKCASNTGATSLCRTIARKFTASIEAGEEETDALMEFFGF